MTAEGLLLGGRYRVGPLLGRGGMGKVFLADDLRLRKKVVVKILDSELAANQRIARRFLNEARIQGRLDHPNIVRATDALDSDGHLAIVVDYVQGVDLEQHLRRRGGRLPLQEAASILGQVCSAVACAHAQGVVHRDLKPGNVMISGCEPAVTAHVMDFGIAKLLGASDMQRTRVGSVLGTPAYMSPEQIRGDVELDARADIYSLGALLYQLVTGALPYDGATDFSVSHQILSGHTPSPPSSLAPLLPAALDRVVSRAMAHDRDGRYQTATELERDLAALAAMLPDAPPTGPPTGATSAAPPTILEDLGPAPASTSPRRSTQDTSGPPMIPLLLLLLMVVAVIAVAFYSSRASRMAVAAEPAARPASHNMVPAREPEAESEPAPTTEPAVEPDRAPPDWYCICYQERVRGVPTRSTACRTTLEQCQELKDAADEGVRAFVANSVTTDCVGLRGSFPWNELGQAHLWKPSKRPGAYWSDRGCLLP